MKFRRRFFKYARDVLYIESTYSKYFLDFFLESLSFSPLEFGCLEQGKWCMRKKLLSLHNILRALSETITNDT